jgi:hypothetical protein
VRGGDSSPSTRLSLVGGRHSGPSCFASLRGERGAETLRAREGPGPCVDRGESPARPVSGAQATRSAPVATRRAPSPDAPLLVAAGPAEGVSLREGRPRAQARGAPLRLAVRKPGDRSSGQRTRSAIGKPKQASRGEGRASGSVPTYRSSCRSRQAVVVVSEASPCSHGGVNGGLGPGGKTIRSEGTSEVRTAARNVDVRGRPEKGP